MLALPRKTQTTTAQLTKRPRGPAVAIASSYQKKKKKMNCK
jgi:hypothetical protein